MSAESEKTPRTIPEISEADLPMVAATLAAALLARGKPDESSAKDAAGAVRQYRQVLGKLARGFKDKDEEGHEM